MKARLNFSRWISAWFCLCLWSICQASELDLMSYFSKHTNIRTHCSGSLSVRWRWAARCCRRSVRICPMWCKCVRARRSRLTTCAHSSATLWKVKSYFFTQICSCQEYLYKEITAPSLSVFNKLYFEGITGIHLFFFLPRHPPSQLVSVHRSNCHDCDPVGSRLQWANQTTAADLPGICQWGCKGTEGTVWLTVCVQRHCIIDTLKLDRATHIAVIFPPEHPCVPRQPVCARGLHYRYPPVRGPGQQLVSGRALSGGQCHHRPGHRTGCLQLRHQRSDKQHVICCSQMLHNKVKLWQYDNRGACELAKCPSDIHVYLFWSTLKTPGKCESSWLSPK